MKKGGSHESWDVAKHSTAESLLHIAGIIDSATDHNDSVLAKSALRLADELEELNLASNELVELFYFRANAWSTIRQVLHRDERQIWHWDQPELLQEIFWLRSSIRHEGFPRTDKLRQCQILTNTGNLLNHLGRPVEAIEYWKRALHIIPNFGMALGNLGFGLKHFARYLYDPGHAAIVMLAAHDKLASLSSETLWDSYNYETTKDAMLNCAKDIATHLNLHEIRAIELDEFSIGRSKSERKYRRWVLDNVLFLSPLNDVGPHSIAAHDIFSLPSMVFPASSPPSLLGLFNQMKQEFVSARFLFWQGQSVETPHFSDRGVNLVDTLDYPLYSIHVEEIKIAFRMAYSIFDKIAFFMNQYWDLGIPEKQISFHSVWFDRRSGQPRKSLNPKFSNYQNLPLRGLYWLSKDLQEDKATSSSGGIDLTETMEPDSSELRAIRHHMEHKYLKVHWLLRNRSGEPTDNSEPFMDTLAYSLTKKDLQAKTLRLLKLARAGLVYLSLAVHREERGKSDRNSATLRFPLFLPTWRP